MKLLLISVKLFIKNIEKINKQSYTTNVVMCKGFIILKVFQIV